MKITKFFDMKNQRLGLQPIPNFQRIVNPLRKRFHIGFTRTANGKIIVSKVADYEENYFRNRIDYGINEYIFGYITE